jgi:hypothetical protein
MDLSNSAARLTTSAVAIAPRHHRRLRVRNVNIQQGCHSRIARRLLGGFGFAGGVDQVCFNRALRADNGPVNIGPAATSHYAIW